MAELPVCCLCYETLGRYGGPVTLPCGHNGCLQCISSLQSRSPVCPLCRKPFSAVQPLVCNHELRDLVSLASSMFVEQGDGWEAFPSASVAAGHALRELKKGQPVRQEPSDSEFSGKATSRDGSGGDLCPSAPLDSGDPDWTDLDHDDSAAGQAVRRGLLELESPKWLPDSYASSCGSCRLAFQPFLRLRHHCRMCGKIYCHSCCHERLLLPPKYGPREPQRVCEQCATLLQPLQPFLAGILSHASQPPVHDAVDNISIRSWLNNPWSSNLTEDIFKATNILQTFSKLGQMNPERSIPSAVLQGARGLVLLSALRLGAGWSQTIGTGLVVTRNPRGGSWSAPCSVALGAMGWGLQLGGELVDLLLVLRTDAAVEALCSHVHVGVGGSVSAAVGPIGRHANAMLTVGLDGNHGSMYSYCISRGAYLGVSVEGTLLSVRHNMNLDFYGYRTTPHQLLLDGTVPPPPAASILYDALHSLADKLAAPQQQQQQALLPEPAAARPVPRPSTADVATAVTTGSTARASSTAAEALAPLLGEHRGGSLHPPAVSPTSTATAPQPAAEARLSAGLDAQRPPASAPRPPPVPTPPAAPVAAANDRPSPPSLLPSPPPSPPSPLPSPPPPLPSPLPAPPPPPPSRPSALYPPVPSPDRVVEDEGEMAGEEYGLAAMFS